MTCSVFKMSLPPHVFIIFQARKQKGCMYTDGNRQTSESLFKKNRKKKSTKVSIAEEAPLSSVFDFLFLCAFYSIHSQCQGFVIFALTSYVEENVE